MRKIGTRQFRENYHKEIKLLPFVVTKNDKDLFKIIPADESIVVTIPKIVVTKKKNVTTIKNVTTNHLDTKNSILFE